MSLSGHNTRSLCLSCSALTRPHLPPRHLTAWWSSPRRPTVRWPPLRHVAQRRGSHYIPQCSNARCPPPRFVAWPPPRRPTTLWPPRHSIVQWPHLALIRYVFPFRVLLTHSPSVLTQELGATPPPCHTGSPSIGAPFFFVSEFMLTGCCHAITTASTA